MILFLRANFLIVVAFLALLFGVNLPTFSQTTVTASAPVTLCVGSTQTLSPIVVSETLAVDFSSPQLNASFILTAPANFEFVSIGSVSYSGGDIVSASIQSVTSSALTILVTISGTGAIDEFAIHNLQVKAISPASSGDILRTTSNPGLFSVLGDASPSDSFSYGSVTSFPIPGLPTAVSPSAICAITGTNPTLSASGAGGAVFNWYDDAG
ncbi:MAG: hypothetical protein ACK47E_17305, partial [Cyclobacteriaceae bacterium]